MTLKAAAGSSRVTDGRAPDRGSAVDPAEPGREKREFAEEQFRRLADGLDRGRDAVRDEQESIRQYVKDVAEVATTLETEQGSCAERRERFEGLIDRFQHTGDAVHPRMAQVMVSFLAGLFVGEGKSEEIKDNLISVLDPGRDAVCEAREERLPGRVRSGPARDAS